MSEKHIFSLYLHPQLTQRTPQEGQIISIIDQDLFRHIFTVLRLEEGEQVELFNNNIVITLQLQSSPKKGIVSGLVQQIKIPKTYRPEIILYQSLLKREAFEEVIYFAAQVGVARIIPLKTEKIHRAWLESKDTSRLEKIMIAACGQAKSYVLPEVQAMQTFEKMLERARNKKSDECFIVCECGGKLLQAILQEITTQHYQTLHVLIGPEGGLTEKELETAQQAGFVCCQLTPTILRAEQAAALMLGVLRSI